MDELDRITGEAAAGSDDPIESIMLRGRAYIRFGLENREPYRIIFMRKPTDTPLPWQYEKILAREQRPDAPGGARRHAAGGATRLLSCILPGWMRCE